MTTGERGRGRSLLGLLFELVLISAGVFLGLLANNWHEDHENHAKAQEAIRNFLAEVQTNLSATQGQRDYHEKLMQELDTFRKSAEPATEERLFKEVHFVGLQPIDFEHTAWDLALATQSLSYLPSDLAFQISKVYTQQSALQTLQNTFLSAAYAPGAMAAENLKGLTTSMQKYLIDVNAKEPVIIESYQKLIPQLKAALESDSGRASFWSRTFSRLKRH